MSTAPQSGDSNGGEMRGWEDIGRAVSVLAWLSFPESYVMAITRPPRQRCVDSQPRSILQLRVSFTNSHLSPLAFPKSSTNVEGRAKCAQSCQAGPRSDGQTESAGSAACVASWMPKCRGPWLCRLTDMFTPDRKCSVDGLPKQRGSKVRGASLVIYLSAANPSRVQPGAGHASVRNKPAYSQKWQS